MTRLLLALGLIYALPSLALTVHVVDQAGDPIPQAMITVTPTEVPAADLSDDGYAPHGVTNWQVGNPVGAVLTNILLVVAFATQHTIMARG